MLDAPTLSLKVEQSVVKNMDEKLSEIASNTTASGENNQVFSVTDKGVILPKDAKYQIPVNYIENSKLPNGTSYGIMENGKFVEKLRIDKGTLPGMKGPNQSHYHLNGKGKHYFPGKTDPGFGMKIKF